MDLDKEVLIVGAGPSGLMMACQLVRWGVSVKIIDQQLYRANESRAFGIQAKSMEIFQNLGLAEQFITKAEVARQAHFFWRGKPILKLNFGKFQLENTPFSFIYFLPQPKTEKILLNYLDQNGLRVERNIKLENFEDHADYMIASLKNEKNGAIEQLKCRYVVGCDGARSSVRHLLKIPFIGGDYQQDFFLADVKLKWPSSLQDEFRIFFDKQGFFLNAPLEQGYTRIITAKITNDVAEATSLNMDEIQKFIRQVSHCDLEILECTWMSRFHLHHRVVQNYQKNNTFLVGDAAHIHSPVGAQGMNTGLQDATNLAWKIALTIQNNLDDQLLKTYELERQFIGKKLIKTTDRIFLLLTSPNKLLGILRPVFFMAASKIIAISRIQQRLFWLISQLGIHYNNNAFIYQKCEQASKEFLAGPSAGFRAPDAPTENTSLFELFKLKPGNLLVFITSDKKPLITDEKLIQLKMQHKWLAVHKFLASAKNRLLFQRYGVTQDSVYFIRPDGYIGFRNSPLNYDDLISYLNQYVQKT